MRKIRSLKGVEETFGQSVAAHVHSVAHVERPFAGYVNLEYTRLGCFARASTDKDPIGELRDKMCVATKSQISKPCRSGLPFFRSKVETDGAVDQCFTLCTQKGFDVFGLLDEHTECRCGATAANVAVWGKYLQMADNRGLVWSYPSPLEDTSGDGLCHAIDVYRYSGWLEEPEADGVSRLLLRASLRDVQYIDNVVRGPTMPPNTLSGNVAKPANKRLAVVGKLWPQSPSGVKVRFAFMPELDQPSRHAFLQAAKVWSYFSFDCITFKEVDATKSRLEVSSAGKECGPDKAGYAGKQGRSLLSLADCGNALHLHHVVHALGSVLGLAVDWEGQVGLNPAAVKDVLKTYRCYKNKKSVRSAAFAQTSQGSALLQEVMNVSAGPPQKFFVPTHPLFK